CTALKQTLSAISCLKYKYISYVPLKMWSFHSWLRGGMRALNRKFEYALQVGSALIGSEFWGRDHLPGTFQAAAALKTTVRAQNTIKLNCAMNDSFFYFIFIADFFWCFRRSGFVVGARESGLGARPNFLYAGKTLVI